MGYFYVLLTILLTIGTWWSGSKAWEEFSKGKFWGKINLQDGASPEKVEITAYFESKPTFRTKPDDSGNFHGTLKTGAYSLALRATGYDPLDFHISVQNGLTPAGKNELIVSAKDVEVRLVDRQGHPYPNIKMQLGKARSGGTIDHVAELNFDADGRARTPKIDYAEYSLVLIEPITDYRKFLWIDGSRPALTPYPGFELKASKDKYEIIFPRILHSEQSGANIGHTYSGADALLFAQKFETVSDLNVCGFGLGIGFGMVGTPSTLQIRNDDGGNPGSDIFLEVIPNKTAVALSDVRSGSYGDSCKEKIATLLQSGSYWMVATYITPISKINMLGGPDQPSSGNRIKKSVDGRTWLDFTFGDLKKWDLFLVE